MKIPEIKWTVGGDPEDIIKFMRKHKPELDEPEHVIIYLEVADFSLRIKLKDHKRDLYLRPREVLMFHEERRVFFTGMPFKEEPRVDEVAYCPVCGGTIPRKEFEDPGVLRCGSPDCLTDEERDESQED